MKSRYKFFPLLFLIFLQSIPAKIISQNLMYYTSGKFRYSILLPEEWKRNDEVVNKQISLVLVSPEGATLSVTFHSLNGIERDEFAKKYEKSLPGQLEGVAVQEKGAMMVRDDEAPYLIIEFSNKGTLVREKTCFFARKGEVAVVTAGFTKEKFHELLPIFDKMMNSFTFETQWEKVEAE